MIEKGKVREGEVVYSADGEKLGKVRACEADVFIIEKGFFFPKDTIARYEDIADVSADGIHMLLGKEAFATDSRDAGTVAEKPGLKERIEEKLEGGRGEVRGAGTDVRVPLAEEEPEVAKRERQAGEVRLKKEVETEHRTVDVPVVKERVHVERVPTDRTAGAGEATFQETTASMPVREEEVEIRKRPVVKEEVRLRKESQVEHRAADAELRKERASIEGEGEGTPRGAPGTFDPEDER